MKPILSKSLLAAAALLGSAHFAGAQVYSTSLGAGNTNFGNFSLASGGYNAIYGGYGNHALGWSCTIGTGSFNFLTGLQNVTAGNFNFVAGASNQPAGAYNVFAGQNNRGTGSQNLVFGSFLDAGALNGSVILSDSNPFSIRTAGARFTNTTANSFTGIFDGGYAWRTNSGQVGMGIGANAGLFIKPNAANSATEGNPAFVGINKPAPIQALDVVGNGAFTGTVTGANGTFTGSVGIGTPAPATKLTVQTELNVDNYGIEHTDGNVRVSTWIGNIGGGEPIRGQIGTRSNHPFDIYTSDLLRFTVSANGNVGINTTTPGTKGKLEVNGTAGSNTSPNAFRTYEATTITTFPAGPNVFGGASIYASNRIISSDYLAFSDERIKRVKGRSDAAADLDALQGIEVTDYSYIDTVSKGGGNHKKVIAQQVEKVFPQAVSQHTDVVPDIYQKATVQDGWVALATDLKVGEHVRLMGEKEEAIHEVLEVREGAFRTAFQPATDKVFVYGREVKDFRTVDYEAISMLNVSATQELARKVEAKDAEIAKLNAKLAALEARDQAREARIARLEAAGTARPARAVPAVLDLKASAQ